MTCIYVHVFDCLIRFWPSHLAPCSSHLVLHKKPRFKISGGKKIKYMTSKPHIRYSHSDSLIRSLTVISSHAVTGV